MRAANNLHLGGYSRITSKCLAIYKLQGPWPHAAILFNPVRHRFSEAEDLKGI